MILLTLQLMLKQKRFGRILLLISKILQLLRSKCAALVQKTEILDDSSI